MSMEITINWKDSDGNNQSESIEAPESTIDFIREIEYMSKMYNNGRHSNAESTRDKLSEKLDDIMRGI